MSLHADTKELLVFLKDNPIIRNMIRADSNKTLLYVGDYDADPMYGDKMFLEGMWKRIEEQKENNGLAYGKTILSDVLRIIPLTDGKPYSTLLEWANKVGEKIIWRELSGIFASNAVGAVSFMMGVNITDDKIFTSDEIPALLENPNIDSVTRDVVEYFLRCRERGESDIRLALIHG